MKIFLTSNSRFWSKYESIITRPPEKSPSPVVSHIKIHTHICFAWSVQISLLIQTRLLFQWRKCYYGLWTRIGVKNILVMDLFQLLSSPDVNWCCGLLWCFYQLSFWRHPFTAEHPLLSKWWNASVPMKIFTFSWTIPLNIKLAKKFENNLNTFVYKLLNYSVFIYKSCVGTFQIHTVVCLSVGLWGIFMSLCFWGDL